MTALSFRRAAPAAFIASLVLAAPASAEDRSAQSANGVQFTLSGAELTVTATPEAPPRIREQMRGTGLTAICASGLDAQTDAELPEGGFEFIVVGNRLALVEGVQRTTFKRDISATVDLCGVQGARGSDIAVAGFTEAGRRAAAESGEEDEPVRREQRRLDRALEAALAEQQARGGRFPSARRLQRAIVRRTDGALKVRLARRLSGVKRRNGVYIVGKPTATRLTLATRTREGGVLVMRVTRRGVSVTERSPAD